MPEFDCNGDTHYCLARIRGLPALAGPSSGDRVAAPDRGVVYDLPVRDRETIPHIAVDFHDEDGSSLQLVIGPDERVQVSSTTVSPYNKIAHLISIDQETGIGQRCTGTFVGSNVLLTAALHLEPGLQRIPRFGRSHTWPERR
ncbi:MAG: hypothetical protein R2849_00790 [Thermomicrobiales bacterium]